jgi:hypothetical protein
MIARRVRGLASVAGVEALAQEAGATTGDLQSQLTKMGLRLDEMAKRFDVYEARIAELEQALGSLRADVSVERAARRIETIDLSKPFLPTRRN